jgi:hypothetical protein
MSAEKLQLVITELEQENGTLKQKYKTKKAELEKMNKEFDDLTSEYSRSKQLWQRKEYGLQLNLKEQVTSTKGMEQVLNSRHHEAYQELVQKNQEILSQQLNSLGGIMQQGSTTIALSTASSYEKMKKEIMQSFQLATEKTIQEMEQSRQLELVNQKQQYEYWLQNKNEKLHQMTNNFNLYYQKKSKQLKKCELEILKLFDYVTSLENILRKAENGEYYIQKMHTMNREGVGGEITGDGGTTLIIPKGIIPTRPAIERKGELDLSRKILRKFQDLQKKDAKAQSDAVEALLGHCGMKEDDYANHLPQNDQELQEHIRGLITSPSMGRDLIVNAATSQQTTPQVPRSSTEKRHSLFNPVPTLPAPSTQGPRSKQINSSRSGSGSAAAQGTPARTIQALNKISNTLRDFPSEGDDNFLDDQNGIRNYQFPDSSRVSSSLHEADNAMVYSPSNTKQISREHLSTYPRPTRGSQSPQHQTSSHRMTADEIEELSLLREENLILKQKLNHFEQLEKEQILETVEGNETIEYIKQLEQESQALRDSVHATAAQLQRSKVEFTVSDTSTDPSHLSSFSSC